MSKEIRGIVEKNPTLLDRCCMFVVKQNEEAYLIVSTDRQASKDNIFVEQGQEIQIRGSCTEYKNFKGIILTEHAEIKIN